MDPRLFQEVTWGSRLFNTYSREEYYNLLEQVTPAKDTYLHIAAGLGHDEVVRKILDIRPELLTEVNTMNDTALHRAARGGHDAVVKLLISLPGGGVDFLRMVNREQETVMHEAVRSSRLEMVKLLIQEDPELLCMVNYAGESPLYLAVEQINLKIAYEILESHPFSSGGPNGRTALHAAIIQRSLDLTDHLLNNLEHVTKEDDNGKTPLHFASELGFVEVVDTLLKNSTSTTTTCLLDNTGLAAIHIAASLGHLDIIEKLIQVQPDIKDLLDRKGRNILHIAIEFQQVRIVKYILNEKMFDGLLNGRDRDGNTPLHQASITGNPYIVNLLARDKRVDVKSFNRKRYTSLAIARSKCDESEEQRKVLVFASLLCVAGPPQSNLKLHREIFKYLIRDQSSIESYKVKANTLLVVATIVSSVTFAAGFAVPEAMATQKNNDFQSFLVLNQQGMYLSVVSVLLLIWLPYIQHKLHLRLLLMFSQVTTTLAFMFMTFGFTLAMSSTIPGGERMMGLRLVLKKLIDYINIVGFLAVLIHLVLIISCYATGVYFLGNGAFPHFLSWVYEYFIRDEEYVSVAERIEKITRESSDDN